MHTSRTQENFDSAISQLRNIADRSFYSYFKKTWVDSQFCTWRFIDRPALVPTTNSGLESINAVIKGFTCRKRLPMPKCLDKLKSIVLAFGQQIKPFRENVAPTVRMKQSGKRLYSECKEGIIRQMLRNGDQ